MKSTLKSILTLSLIAAASFASAADPEVTQFEHKLKELYPSTTFKSVRTTPIKDIYEVQMGTNLSYVDATGRYFMFGRLFDMPSQSDLTEGRMQEISKVDMKDLPLGDAIKTVRGNGSRTLIVFSDPDCPFCRQLETNMKTLTDVTIYTFLYPLASIHPDARRKSVNIWCAKNKSAAWDAFMLNGQAAPDANCENPVDRNVALGNSMSINGTPTMFSGDGRKRSGAADAAFLHAWLDQAPKAAASTKVGQK